MSEKRTDDLIAELRADGYDVEVIPKVPRPEADRIADEEAGIRLLSGFVVSKADNFPFPEADSDEENEHRAALARIIRDQMTGHAGELLALAIDPGTPSRWVGMRPTRKVVFENQGKQKTVFVDQQVAAFIYRLKATLPRASLDAHVKAAQEEFGLGRSRIYKIWKSHLESVKRVSIK